MSACFCSCRDCKLFQSDQTSSFSSLIKPSDHRVFQSDQTSRINLACSQYHTAFRHTVWPIPESFSGLFCCKHGGEFEIIAKMFLKYCAVLEKKISEGNWAPVCVPLAHFWRTKSLSFLETGFQRLRSEVASKGGGQETSKY